MERFPRGTLPPSAFRAVATVAPHAVVKAAPAVVTAVAERAPQCDLTTTCPTCMIEMQSEHAHYRCTRCGYRDSCCF
jgi:tRNA(Ile2) C34 agmatinyltransferase TiaS